MTKRILAILLALTLSLTMFALPTFAAGEVGVTQSGNDLIANWSAVEGAKNYTVKVYKDNAVVETKTATTNTCSYTITASGSYQFIVEAAGTNGVVSYTSAVTPATYVQSSTANGLKFTRNGTSVEVSWSAPAGTTGTVTYKVSYTVGGVSKNPVKVTGTSFTISDVPTTSAVSATVTYEDVQVGGTYKEGTIGSATLPASGNATGGTTNTPSTTGTLTYNNGVLSWASVGTGISYKVSYVYGGKTYTNTTSYNYYQVPVGVTSATVTYGFENGTRFTEVGQVGTYTASNTSATTGVTYNNGYLSWASKGTGYIYYITYNTANGNAYTYVESNSWQAPTGCTNATVYYGVFANGSFQSYGTVGYWSSTNNGTATGSVKLLSGTRYVYWNNVSNVSIYYIYSGNTQIGIVQNTSYTVPAGYSNVTVKYYSNGSLVTLGTVYLSSTSGNTNTSTTTVTTEGTNCTVVSTASSSTVTWKSTGSSSYTVYYITGNDVKFTTVTTNSAIVPAGTATGVTIMINDASGYNVAGANVKQVSGTTSNTTGVKSETKNLTLTAVNSWKTTVSWNKVSSAEYYMVLYSKYGAATDNTDATLATSFELPYGSGTDYQVYVYAVNASGVRSLVGYATHIASDTSSSNGTTTTTPTGSEYVTGFKGTQNGSNKIRLSWTAAEGATSYTVYWKRSSNTTWKKATTTSKTAVILKGLNNGTSYDFKIVANDKDSSILTMAPSATGNATKTTTDPKTETTVVKVPTITYATSTASGTASVKWTAVTGATSYKVYFAPSGESTYKLKATVTDNGCTVTGLTKGTYKVRIKALVNGTWTTLKDCDYESVVVG